MQIAFADCDTICSPEGPAPSPLCRKHSPDTALLVVHSMLQIGETICSPDAPVALPTIQVEEPTVSMTFKVRTHTCSVTHL